MAAHNHKHEDIIEFDSLDQLPPQGAVVGNEDDSYRVLPSGEAQKIETVGAKTSLFDHPLVRKGQKAVLGAALTATLGLPASCSRDEDITVIENHQTVTTPAESKMTIGEKGVYYNPNNSISGDAANAASMYESVVTQPGYMNDTNGYGIFTGNNVSYMSGISLVPNSFSTSQNTYNGIGALTVRDLQGIVNSKNGWLRDGAGNQVATTFTKDNAPDKRAYMMDLRKDDIADAVVAYGVDIGKKNPNKKGIVVDEPDQALYFNNVFPGLSDAFADVYRRIAFANYYGYPLADEYKKDSAGNPIKDSAGKRISNIKTLPGADGRYVAQNLTTGQQYTPLKIAADIFSGIQPTPDGNFASDAMLKAVAYAYCNMTLESRVYGKAGQPTDGTYRAAVTERIMKYASYNKEAGRQEFTINAYEPAVNNTSDGYEQAALETAKYWDGVRKQVEQTYGLKMKINIMIGGINADGYFLNNSGQDFIEGRKMKTTLPAKAAAQGIILSYNEKQHAPEADASELRKPEGGTISWSEALASHKASEANRGESKEALASNEPTATISWKDALASTKDAKREAIQKPEGSHAEQQALRKENAPEGRSLA